ncbi:hypothetical protein NYZ99_17050 [Maribacter litopenaei]|uniref:DUF4175 domain-containing protein n=1 Tax=Maribacter litopenaei TaxID=2976127 RepID=A0ABY5Y878_9FLAO|nr:hypothetical protein [Maribacter litopenaei]UWX54572.1 hypothetical protein NYZ99_17050 [Maribacter litopenaei]
MREAQDILRKALLKWRLIKSAEVFLSSLAVGLTAYFLFSNLLVGFICFLGTLLIASIYLRPWKYTLKNLCSHINGTIAPMEHSTELLLENEGQLPLLSQIQRVRAGETLQRHKSKIRFKNVLGPIIGISFVCVLVAWLLHISGILHGGQNQLEVPKSDVVNFQVLDSLDEEIIPPNIISWQIRIKYPGYTQKADEYTSQMNLDVLEGSRVTWNIQFDQSLNGVQLQFGEDSLYMDKIKDTYSKTKLADYSSFYAIKFRDSLGNAYLSDLYALETYSDEPPSIELEGLQQFSSFEYESPQKLTFKTQLNDDFGLTDVAIIATVSKGSGESVKFREERLGFDSKLVAGTKNQNFTKTLNLKELNMGPGDELYFYVEAKDNKQPGPNISRTETFFSVIEDTVTNQFAVEGTLGADLMPDYFRSQRQLIIDTEKLIAEKPVIEKRNSTLEVMSWALTKKHYG